MALVYFEVAMLFLRKKPINQYIFAVAPLSVVPPPPLKIDSQLRARGNENSKVISMC